MSSPQFGPIGVFDSGLGGLTALRRLRALAPACDLIYFGDTARVPYGGRDTATLLRFAREDAALLQQLGAQQALVACGTISSSLSKEDWASLPLPCQGVVDAAVNAALAATRCGRVGILATEASIRSGSYAAALAAARPDVLTVPVACPEFVPLIESGRAGSEEMRLAARRYLEPVLAAGCDTVILGCTHYPLAADILATECGPTVTLIDCGGEAAAALLAGLPAEALDGTGTLRCYVSGDAEAFARNAAVLLGGELQLNTVQQACAGN